MIKKEEAMIADAPKKKKKGYYYNLRKNIFPKRDKQCSSIPSTLHMEGQNSVKSGKTYPP
jgi:hypothetical protein